ncbi:MAG TPA: HD domain-containing protein, partial [Casimicrobiaceae bacterium]|nr:HD domain-containing protein [Casimicrobiaceae bacterium]
MVAVTHAAPPAAVPEAVGAWLDSLSDIYSDADRRRFSAAYAMAHDALAEAAGTDGERLVARGLGTATILAAQRLDPDSLTAALLVGLPMSGRYERDAVIAAFGDDVATLVEGVARMNAVQAIPIGASHEQRAAQAENLRKMLLAMVED